MARVQIIICVCTWLHGPTARLALTVPNGPTDNDGCRPRGPTGIHWQLRLYKSTVHHVLMTPHVSRRVQDFACVSRVSGTHDRIRSIACFNRYHTGRHHSYSSLLLINSGSTQALHYDSFCGFSVQDGSRKYPPSWSS
jgi:hypothetical protein